MHTFGERLQALRKQRGLSQTEFAAQLTTRGMPNMTQTKISALENRETAPRQKVVELLASFFGVPVAFFFAEPVEGQRPAAQAYIANRLDVVYIARLLGLDKSRRTMSHAWQRLYDDEEYWDT